MYKNKSGPAIGFIEFSGKHIAAQFSHQRHRRKVEHKTNAVTRTTTRVVQFSVCAKHHQKLVKTWKQKLCVNRIDAAAFSIKSEKRACLICLPNYIAVDGWW